MRTFFHTIVNCPTNPSYAQPEARSGVIPTQLWTDRPIIHDIPQRDTGGSMRPEIDGFSESCEEILFFRLEMRRGVNWFDTHLVDIFNAFSTGAASLYTLHHNEHHIPQASQWQHDAFTAKYQWLKLNFPAFIYSLAGRISPRMSWLNSNQPRSPVSGHPGHAWPTI